ncbi:hypothetical protein QEH56_10330 [Pelagicoccus enzymogenes]|uniref:hypothetical protein n=1 Tax=Pelagicoccus enzymogenes TaxID=2773457 RepID=UPI00280EE67C|nr:hypothetical protein [Pelagicoccus enzymogenes]MDQ8198547.1 hypothetical protein [Pelagicoccus enzymogenes]
MSLRSQRFYKSGFYFLCAVSLTSALLLLREARQAEPGQERAFAAESAPPPSPSLRTAPVQRLDDSSSPSADDAPDSKPALTLEDKFDFLIELREHPSVDLNIRVFNFFEGEIKADTASLFGLSSSQTKQLNALFEETHAALLSQRVAHSQIEANPDGSLNLILNPFLENGAEIYDSFYDQMEEILGPKKLRALDRISGEQINNHFNEFGAEVSRYTLWAQADHRGNRRYHYERRTDRENGYSTNSGNFQLEGPSLTHRLHDKELAALLPPEAMAQLRNLPILQSKPET